MVDKIVVGFEDTIRKRIVEYDLPEVLGQVEVGAFRRHTDNGDV